MRFIRSKFLALPSFLSWGAVIAGVLCLVPQRAIASENPPADANVPKSSDRPSKRPRIPVHIHNLDKPATIDPIIPQKPLDPLPSSPALGSPADLPIPAAPIEPSPISRDVSPASSNPTPIDPSSPLVSQVPTAAPDQPSDASQERTSDDETEADPELGVLQLRELELQLRRSPPPPSVFLSAGMSYYKSDNILLDQIDPIDEQLISAQVLLLAAPRLNTRTSLLAAMEGSVIRYSDLTELDYNELEFRLGIRHFLSRRMYGEVGWSNQQLFEADGGDRFLNDHSLRLTLARRDPMLPRLNLDSFYQLRYSFAEPSDRSRILNTIGVSLKYDILNNLQAGLSYQFLLANFTEQDRQDTYHQLIAQLNYNLNRTTRISLYGGFSFGDSTRSDIGFDSTLFGASIDINLSLF